MLILLALPVIVAVAAMHRYLQTFAPTNQLARRVRAQEPRWSTAAVLSVLVAALLVAMHGLGEAVGNGAPGWLNLIVLVLAWDAIKLAALVCAVLARCALLIASRAFRRGGERPYDGSAVVRCD
jgi:hypothetical protein